MITSNERLELIRFRHQRLIDMTMENMAPARARAVRTAYANDLEDEVIKKLDTFNPGETDVIC